MRGWPRCPRFRAFAALCILVCPDQSDAMAAAVRRKEKGGAWNAKIDWCHRQEKGGGRRKGARKERLNQRAMGEGMSALPLRLLPCCVCACAQAVEHGCCRGRKATELCACEDRQPLLCPGPAAKRKHSRATHSTPQQRIQAPHTTHTRLGNAPVCGRVGCRHRTPARRNSRRRRSGLTGLRDDRPVGFWQRASCGSPRVGCRCTPCWCSPSLFAGEWRAKLHLPVAEPTPAILFRCRQQRWPAAWLTVAAPVSLSTLALHGCARARATRTAGLRG
jgi:hypothetical protein